MHNFVESQSIVASRGICQTIVLPQIELLAAAARHADVLVRTAAITELIRLLNGRSPTVRAELTSTIVPRALALLAEEQEPIPRKLLNDLCATAN